MKILKYLSWLLMTLIVFCACVYCGVSSLWDGVDIALILSHYQLVLSCPLMPYWKEILLGCVIFLLITFLLCRYWKIAFPLMLIGCITLFFINYHPSPKEENVSLFKKEYVIPHVIFPKGQKKKNIIVISLESIEDLFTWSDVTGGENLIPKLTELKKEGIVFDGYYNLQIMVPTIPAFIAMNCGIPRGTSIWKIFANLFKTKEYGGYPNAFCLSDLLAQYGWETYFIMGAKCTDEGNDKFLERHPMSVSVGKKELEKLGYLQKDSGYRIPDSELIRFIKETLNKKRTDAPFFVYFITGNSHAPKEFVAEAFCEKKYGDGRDAIKCLDKQIFDFVRWCQKQPWYQNTIIYLVGDHLSWGLDKTEIFRVKNAKKYPRRQIYNLVLDGSNPLNKGVIKKEFTQVDFAPTILESAGFKLLPRKWGIGVSLWSDEPTLVEQLGAKKFEQELEASQKDYFDMIYGKQYEVSEDH
ncbi:MAG: LTA synthase family protein [Alphaproteobacteria bacterium]|nr:LTA synthase family protein [Alphaproteobacteria bacterium]